MNDFDSLLTVVTAQAKAVGVPVSDKIDGHIRINKRAKKRFGRCTAVNGRYVIELSEMLLEAPEKSCRQTIAHELIHTCPGCMNHGRLFKKYAGMMNRAYGYDIKRTNSCSEMGVEAPLDDEMRHSQEARYILLCESCGKRIGRMRMSKAVAKPFMYRCACGGGLKRIK